MKKGFPRQVERNAEIYELWKREHDNISLEAIGQKYRGLGPKGKKGLSRTRVLKIVQDEARRRGEPVPGRQAVAV